MEVNSVRMSHLLTEQKAELPPKPFDASNIIWKKSSRAMSSHQLLAQNP
jgi:hypothetical protein